MSIHQRIRDGRKRLGMTEQQFGDAVGVTRGAVQQWEKEGGTAPRRKNQQAVADILGISVAELMAQVGQASPVSPAGGFGTPVATQSDPDALVIRQYAAGGGMGRGFNLADNPPGHIKSWHVDHEWLRLNVPVHTGVRNLAIVTGFGPSMRPMFNPGDPLLVDTGVKVIDHEGVYFFRVGEEGFIKLIQRVPSAIEAVFFAQSSLLTGWSYLFQSALIVFLAVASFSIYNHSIATNPMEQQMSKTAESGLQITKDLLNPWIPCTGGYKWFLKKFPQGGSYAEVQSALRADKRYDDSSWLMSRVFESFLEHPERIDGIVQSEVKKAIDETIGSPDSSSGDSSTAASSGDSSKAASSGNYSKAASSGNYSTAASSGDYSKAEATGEMTVAMVAGTNGKARAGNKGAFALAWNSGEQIRIAVGIVGEEGIKADTWYRVDGSGNLVEVSK